MRLEVLGFSCAAPLDGACSSYLVTSGDATVLLDCGPGTLERLWRRQLLGALDAIVISHMHSDHVLDLVAFAGEVAVDLRGERRPALHVPAGNGREVLDALDAVFAPDRTGATRFDTAFDVRPYAPDDELAIGELSIRFAATAHPQPCFASRVSDGRAALVYSADSAPAEALDELAAGAELLVLDATFPDDAERANAWGHMSAEQAGELAARAGARHLVLTHLLPGSREAYAAAAARRFSGRVDVAREGLAIAL